MDNDRAAWLKDMLEAVGELEGHYSYFTTLSTIKKDLQKQLGETCFYCKEDDDKITIATYTYTTKYDEQPVPVCDKHAEFVRGHAPEKKLTPYKKAD